MRVANIRDGHFYTGRMIVCPHSLLKHHTAQLLVAFLALGPLTSSTPRVFAGNLFGQDATQDETEKHKHSKDHAKDGKKDGTNDGASGSAPAVTGSTPAPTTASSTATRFHWYATLHDDTDASATHAPTNQNVHCFGADGTSVGTVLGAAPTQLGQLQDLRGMLPLADGTLLLIAAWKNNTKVLQYAAADANGQRAFSRVFTEQSASNPLLVHPYCLAQAPDGTIYASNQDSNTVTRYSAPSSSSAGTPMQGDNALQTAANAGLVVPSQTLHKDGIKEVRGIAFGPDGKLYVADRGKGEVSRWDATSARREAVLLSKSDGLETPIQLLFSADGTKLYISDNKENKVFCMSVADRTLTTLIDSDAGIDASSALAIEGPWLYVGSRKARAILRFKLSDGSADSAPFISNLSDNPEFFVRNP